MTDKDMFKSSTYQSLNISENHLEWAEGEAIKYLCRHKLKGKEQSLRKAIHCIEIIIERDYS